MTGLTFRVPACEWWSANNHDIHHYRRARLAKEWRYAADMAARHATVKARQETGKGPWSRILLERWTVDALLAWGDRRMRDPHNYAGTVIKACIDGLVDAGIAAADDSQHLLSTTQRRHPNDGPGFPPGVYLTVRELVRGSADATN